MQEATTSSGHRRGVSRPASPDRRYWTPTGPRGSNRTETHAKNGSGTGGRSADQRVHHGPTPLLQLQPAWHSGQVGAVYRPVCILLAVTVSPPTASARERILVTAGRLFYTEGIRAVGIDRVIAEAGVAKATLYAHFASKDELVVAYLQHVDEIWRAELRAAAVATGDEPRAQLAGVFDAVRSACAREGYAGCGFLNAASKYRAGTAPRQIAIDHKARVGPWPAGVAKRAGASDPDLLAGQLAVLLDGALADTALEGNASPARRRG